MPLLSKEELLQRTCASIELSGWRPLVLQSEHPFELLALKGGQSPQKLLVYIWNITPGGPLRVRPLGEFRIQMTSVDFPLKVGEGFRTLLLGWSGEFGVFAGFDVQHHITSKSRSPSIQIKERTLVEASQRGMAFQSRGRNEIAVAFAPDQFMNYVLQRRSLHLFRHLQEVELLEIASTGKDLAPKEVEIVPRERREVLRIVAEWHRQRDFRQRVLSAYNHHCAICQIQLELVEAAHIIPIGAPGSNDLTSNGLALCVLHHKAYDDSLIGIKGDYHIIVNEAKLKELQHRNLVTGEQLLRSLMCSTILLPQKRADWPCPEFLTEGMRLRGWQVG